MRCSELQESVISIQLDTIVAGNLLTGLDRFLIVVEEGSKQKSGAIDFSQTYNIKPHASTKSNPEGYSIVILCIHKSSRITNDFIAPSLRSRFPAQECPGLTKATNAAMPYKIPVKSESSVSTAGVVRLQPQQIPRLQYLRKSSCIGQTRSGQLAHGR